MEHVYEKFGTISKQKRKSWSLEHSINKTTQQLWNKQKLGPQTRHPEYKDPVQNGTSRGLEHSKKATPRKQGPSTALEIITPKTRTQYSFGNNHPENKDPVQLWK